MEEDVLAAEDKWKENPDLVRDVNNMSLIYGENSIVVRFAIFTSLLQIKF